MPKENDVLKKLILGLALMLGALAVSQGSSQATPLGSSAQIPATGPEQVQKAQYYYYRRWRPRRYHYRRYYRPRAYYYRPRYYRPYRYYRPVRFYRPYRYYW